VAVAPPLYTCKLKPGIRVANVQIKVSPTKSVELARAFLSA